MFQTLLCMSILFTLSHYLFPILSLKELDPEMALLYNTTERELSEHDLRKKTANTPHQIYQFLKLKHPISPIAEYRGLPPNLNLWPPPQICVCVYYLCVWVGSFWKIWDCYYCLWCPGVIGQRLFAAHRVSACLIVCVWVSVCAVYVLNPWGRDLVWWLKCFLFGAFTWHLNWFNNDTQNNPQWTFVPQAI